MDERAVIALLDPILLLALMVPAWLIARLIRPKPSVLQAVSDTLLCAVTVVPIVAFTLCLITRSYVSVVWVLSTAAGVSLLGASALFRHGVSGWRQRIFSFSRAKPGDRAALIGAVVVFAVFLLNYDRSHFQYGCINGVVMQALTPQAAGAFDPHSGAQHQDWGAPEDRDASLGMGLIDVHGTGQRLGTTAVIAPMVAVFKVWGFRLTYALLPALCLLFGFRLLRALSVDPRIALAGGLIGLLNPYILKIVILDENVMAFCFVTVALALLVERGSVTLAGIALGAALGIRHIDLFFVLTAALLVGRRAQRLAVLTLVTVAAALPCLIHHQVTYGSIFAHEHFVDEVFAATPHHFMGWSFDYMGLLNFPFTDHLIRTPYNPFPTALYYPLNTLAHVGTLLGAVALLGAWRLWADHRALTVALLMWLIPQYGVLSVLENWMDPNKMGVVVCLFPVLVLTLGLGLQWLFALRGQFSQRPRYGGVRRIAILCVTTALLSGTAIAMDKLHVDDDNRFYLKYPNVRIERSEYFAFERSLVTTGNPLPDLYWLQQYSRMRPWRRLSTMLTDWVYRDFRRPNAPIEDHKGELVAVTLDMSQPIIGNSNFLVPGRHATEIDAVGGNTQLELVGLNGWEAVPLNVRLIRTATNEVVVYLSFGKDGVADMSSERRYTVEEQARPQLKPRYVRGASITLILRAGDRLKILETVSLDEVLVYLWEVNVSEDDISAVKARKMFHN